MSQSNSARPAEVTSACMISASRDQRRKGVTTETSSAGVWDTTSKYRFDGMRLYLQPLMTTFSVSEFRGVRGKVSLDVAHPASADASREQP